MTVQLKNLTLVYPDKPPLFKNLHLKMGTRDFILIQGASGSGKSSLLRLLNRLQDPSGGEILIDEKPIDRYQVTDFRRRIGYVQQVPVMVPGSVEENLLLPFQFKSSQMFEPPSRSDLRTWMDNFLLKDIGLDEDAARLSVGQKQRIALIRTILSKPDIILCDEPTSALDQDSKLIVEEWLERIHEERNTGVILVTHLDFKPSQISLRRYRLCADGLTEMPAS